MKLMLFFTLILSAQGFAFEKYDVILNFSFQPTLSTYAHSNFNIESLSDLDLKEGKDHNLYLPRKGGIQPVLQLGEVKYKFWALKVAKNGGSRTFTFRNMLNDIYLTILETDEKYVLFGLNQEIEVMKN
jgi:hypothetical protein